jgi:acyl phosphate:glycerol-3-phosphate acyltransferase
MEIETLALVLAGYLVGSIPFSWLVARTRGIDLRKVGSGNTGASNVWRALGFRYFIVALVLDIFKGWLPVFVALNIVHLPAFGTVLVGLAAVLGHIFPIFMRFRGGKAVATTGGVILGFAPLLTLAAAIIWTIVYKISGYPSVASLLDGLLIALAGTALAFTGRLDPLFAAFIWLAVAAIIYLHRANIGRLLRGKEMGIGQKH